MATIHDVARRAQVSIGTVSRVLNGHRSVLPTTRRAVELAIDDLGYRPNALARGLRAGRTRLLGLLVPYVGSMMAQLMHGAEAAALEHGHMLLLGGAHDDQAIEATQLRALLERRVDGILCAPVEDGRPLVEPLRAARVPAVLLDVGRATGELPVMLPEEAAAFRELLAELAALGHRRLGVILKWRGYALGPHRLDLLRRLCPEAGLDLDPARVRTVESDAAAGAACLDLLEREPGITALVVGAHSLVPACLLASRQAGRSIPRDLSLVTVGDSDWAAAMTPALHVVRIDMRAAGRLGVELLLRQLAGDRTVPATTPLPAQYVRRESLGPPGPRG